MSYTIKSNVPADRNLDLSEAKSLLTLQELLAFYGNLFQQDSAMPRKRKKDLTTSVRKRFNGYFSHRQQYSRLARTAARPKPFPTQPFQA